MPHTHETLDETTQRHVRDFKNLGLDESAADLLRRKYGTTTKEIEALQKLALVTTGRSYETFTGERLYSLTTSMTDWFDGYEYVRDGLTGKHLIERVNGRYGKVYYVPTGAAFDLLLDDSPFDLNESWLHKRGTALLRTYYQGLNHIRGVVSYGRIGVGDQRCDLRVIPASRAFRRQLPPPGDGAILSEVMTDHHNTDRVIERYRALHTANEDSLWVFENVKTMNKWIRRLAARGELPPSAEQYTWSPKTPISVVQERVNEWDAPGMRFVTTLDRIERWINECDDKWDRLAAAPDS